ncbi:arylsulfotransferase family protein [Spirillospora sp. CA-128828]|uniref:arylsulfotransferase family protein n=1 Tax=Spirillospora sp. CA-128828 TaxID=3240033 RepID=UPI003D8B89DC
MSRRSDEPLGLLFSPASSYPTPVAYVVDRDGAILHTWSHTHGQPRPQDDPPSYLRGWNHVEMDDAGNLFAIVPLHALLKLTPDSRLEWACDVAAHHDLAVTADGTVLALGEDPRRVDDGGSGQVVLDNPISTITADGVIKSEVSLYDVLRTDPALRRLIDTAVRRRGTAFRRRGWPLRDDGVPDETAAETRAILRTGRHDGERRRALRLLRALPGSPCDVLHTNTIEVLPPHPTGLWSHGNVLVCMRELDAIAVVDLAGHRVAWWWGPGELSRPHQPTLLPDGRILIFDNGVERRRSRLVMVDPVAGGIVWSWTASPPESFFCPLAGGAEPLPGGALLVTNSTAGAAFEVTAGGEIAWEMSLPVEVYGADRGRVSIYRMSAVPTGALAQGAAGRAPAGAGPAETERVTS